MSCNGILGLGLGLQGCPQVLGFLGDVNLGLGLGLGLGLQGCPQVLGFLGDVNFLRPITKVIDMPKTSLKCIGANPRTGAR